MERPSEVIRAELAEFEQKLAAHAAIGLPVEPMYGSRALEPENGWSQEQLDTYAAFFDARNAYWETHWFLKMDIARLKRELAEALEDEAVYAGIRALFGSE